MKALRTATDWLVGRIAFTLMALLRRLDLERSSRISGKIAATVGPRLAVSRLGRNNLQAAFPEKSAHEIETILKGVWANLGQVAGEFVHLDRLWDYDLDHPERSRIDIPDVDIFKALRDQGGPSLIFTAHLANWELPALAAARHGLKVSSLYRPPNNPYLADAILKIRGQNMGHLQPSGSNAPLALARQLENQMHVGILIDQHLTRGVPVQFFGRTCKANPTIARLAQHFDCPVHGVRVIRLPEHRFRLDITPAITLPRTENGKIDDAAAMQTLTSIVEGWVREFPEQWLWLHRRWR